MKPNYVMEEGVHNTYTFIKDCITEKKSISFMYKDHERICSPHTIGHFNGIERVLVYQYGGTSSQGLPAGGSWRCIDLSGVSNLTIVSPQEWHTGDRHTRKQSCIQNVDLEVDY